MSVIVMTKFPGKASEMERLAADQHSETLKRVSQLGRDRGCLHHMFVEDTDGNLLVIDEWDSEDSFNDFFSGTAADDIKQMTADAGVTGPPTSTTYRILDTADRF